jgi:hypothetical protein
MGGNNQLGTGRKGLALIRPEVREPTRNAARLFAGAGPPTAATKALQTLALQHPLNPVLASPPKSCAESAQTSQHPKASR